MDFKTWLNEITAGDYGALVPGWEGDPKGPFEDPKRMPHDPKFWRNYYYQKEKAEKELEQAEKELKKDRSQEAKEKYGQAMAGALWSAIPTVPESKPRGEYQGYPTWDTWALLLWADNNREPYEKFRKYAKMDDDLAKTIMRRYAKRHKKDVDEIGAYKVDLDEVDWDKVLENFREE